ncbi:MAG: COG4315 family predicted lipoprotein [Solirubrobacterales bacterium]
MLSTLKKFVLVVLPVAALAFAASGCGEDDTSRNYAPTKDSSAANGPKVTTRSSANGTILADSSGRAYYVFSRDEDGISNCVDACSGAWPPATISGEPQAMREAEQSKIGTIKRDPATQLTYDGKPLYYYSGDKKPKQVTGNGVESFSGTWFTVKPNGDTTD